MVSCSICLEVYKGEVCFLVFWSFFIYILVCCLFISNGFMFFSGFFWEFYVFFIYGNFNSLFYVRGKYGNIVVIVRFGMRGVVTVIG